MFVCVCLCGFKDQTPPSGRPGPVRRSVYLVSRPTSIYFIKILQCLFCMVSMTYVTNDERQCLGLQTLVLGMHRYGNYWPMPMSMFEITLWPMADANADVIHSPFYAMKYIKYI